jgi:4-amino-4-deoxy-L-arabinose transferase-like glycosyltransferase
VTGGEIEYFWETATVLSTLTYQKSTYPGSTNPMKSQQQHDIEKYLVIFLVAYVAIWTAMCFFLRSPAPYDAVEAANWGRHLAFGYAKNPYFVGWVGRMSFFINGGNPSDFAYYLFHMGGIAIGIYGVWLIAVRLFEDLRTALMAVMALSLTSVISYNAIPYNDNFLLVTLWPYLFYFFIKACFDDRRYWILTGLIAGLALMTKYSTASFVPFMLLYTVLNKDVRQSYRSWEIYAGIAVICTICIPNVAWLASNHFAAFTWVSRQISERDVGHSLLAYLAAFYPFILLYVVMNAVGSFAPRPHLTKEQRAFNWVYLPPIAIILTVFLFIDGGRLNEWLQPFTIFYSIALLIWFKPELSDKAYITTLRVFGGCAVFVIAGYALVQTVFDEKVNYNRFLVPLAQEANQLWRDRTGLPLMYVGGEGGHDWLILYAPDYPRVINLWSPLKETAVSNKKISDEKIKTHGVLLIAGRACAPDVFTTTFEEHPFMSTAEQVDHEFEFRGTKRRYCLGYFLPQADMLPNVDHKKFE